MNEPAVKRMTVDEFLPWAAAQPAGRYELVCGEIVAMAPERAEHARAKAHVWRALDAAIAKAGVPCEAFVDGLTVKIDEYTSYEPDALVNCGPAVPGSSIVAPSPVVIVEVLSPSTAGIDKQVKMTDYFRLASVQHFIVVDLTRNLVVHFRRAENGTVSAAFLSDGDIVLDPPGLTLPVAVCLG